MTQGKLVIMLLRRPKLSSFGAVMLWQMTGICYLQSSAVDWVVASSYIAIAS